MSRLKPIKNLSPNCYALMLLQCMHVYARSSIDHQRAMRIQAALRNDLFCVVKMQPCAVQYNCLQIEIDHVLASFALETNGSKFEGASCLKNNLYFSMTFTIMELTCATIYIHAWISVGLKRENSSIKIHKRNCSMVCMASTGSKSLTITQFNPASDFPSDEKAFMG